MQSLPANSYQNFSTANNDIEQLRFRINNISIKGRLAPSSTGLFQQLFFTLFSPLIIFLLYSPSTLKFSLFFPIAHYRIYLLYELLKVDRFFYASGRLGDNYLQKFHLKPYFNTNLDCQRLHFTFNCLSLIWKTCSFFCNALSYIHFLLQCLKSLYFSLQMC